MAAGRTSFAAFLVSVFLLLLTHAYYPKWQMPATEATISWDVSGYYFYLPAAFIYKDLKKVAFRDSIVQAYGMSKAPYQAYNHPSGNRVMKYSAGMAVQYLPFFALGHAAARASSYPADGFSRPYQMAISLGSLLVAILGLWYLRKVLGRYFSDSATAFTLLLITLATNYLNYAAIDHAMTHNWLFTLYALLMWQSLRYYEGPSWWRALAIGATVGLMALTRPTEIIALLLPLLWGVRSWDGLLERVRFFLQPQGIGHLLVAGVGVAALGSLQLLYWQYAVGEWLVYSYQDQGFSWLNPHLWEGFFSGRAGWLVYTPAMAMALIGFLPLFGKHPGLWVPALLFSALFIYIAFAWDIWWYGGSLGQRAMVQAYPVLALPLAALADWAWPRIGLRALLIGAGLLCTGYNLWLTHQAHRGGLFVSEQMTLPYLRAALFRMEVPEEARKLLDTPELYPGTPQRLALLDHLDFEQDSVAHDCPIPPIAGERSFCLSPAQPFTPALTAPASAITTPWVRVEGAFRCHQKEWEYWRMAQLTLKFKRGGEAVQTRFFRVFRLMGPNSTRTLYLDARVPEAGFDQVEAFVWQAESDKPLAIDDLKLYGVE